MEKFHNYGKLPPVWKGSTSVEKFLEHKKAPEVWEKCTSVENFHKCGKVKFK